MRTSERLRDRLLWILVALVGLCVIAYFVADRYYTASGASECFPYCTFKQDLSNNVAGGALMLMVALTIAWSARWVLLGRRAARRRDVT